MAKIITEQKFKEAFLLSLFIHPAQFSNKLIAEAYNVIAIEKQYKLITRWSVRKFRKTLASKIIVYPSHI